MGSTAIAPGSLLPSATSSSSSAPRSMRFTKGCRWRHRERLARSHSRRSCTGGMSEHRNAFLEERVHERLTNQYWITRIRRILDERCTDTKRDAECPASRFVSSCHAAVHKPLEITGCIGSVRPARRMPARRSSTAPRPPPSLHQSSCSTCATAFCNAVGASSEPPTDEAR